MVVSGASVHSSHTDLAPGIATGNPVRIGTAGVVGSVPGVGVSPPGDGEVGGTVGVAGGATTAGSA